MNRRIGHQCVCALMAALAIGRPAVANEDLHIAPPPPGVEPSGYGCKPSKRIAGTYLEVKICKKFFVNTTPNGAMGVAHIYTRLENIYPQDNGPSYLLWRMEVLDNGKTVDDCHDSSYLTPGDFAICAVNVPSNSSTPASLRLTWGEDQRKDTF